jgi:hypothetical protein
MKLREGRVRIENAKVLRIYADELSISTKAVADAYKRRWQIELFLGCLKQSLKNPPFSKDPRKCRAHSVGGGVDDLTCCTCCDAPPRSPMP